jgi:hypothetical protein
MSTEISLLPVNIEDIFEEILTEDNLSKSIVDLSLSLETRLKAVNMYYQKEGGNNMIETINKLGTMYEMSGARLLRQFLFSICEKCEIDPFLQSLAAKALISYSDKDEIGYKAIDLVYPRLGLEIGTPYKIDFVKMLMKSPLHRDNAKSYFCEIINDNKLDCDYRYKTILGLEYKCNGDEKHDNEKSEKMSYFIKESLLEFIKNDNNRVMYRILSGQYLLQKFKNEDQTLIENILISFAKDDKIEYNLRADATDVLLQLGSEDIKKEAQNIILHLGVGNKNIATVYDNAQNVHTKQVEESILEALEFLQTFNLLKHKGKTITVEFVENKILEMLKDEKDSKDKCDKIKIAFNRIIMDRALYSKFNCSLSLILLKVWTYLTGHKNEEEITKRLIEELYEMAGTCSSGFASRLINTISGFGDFSMRISWEDQIIANLTGRLNARIREMDNLKLQEKVVEEMTIPSFNYDLRKNFLKFFRKNMLSIREEMYQEFKNHISDSDYDLYFRKAISMYENGN